MSLFPQISVVFTLQRDFLQQIKIIVLPQQKKKKSKILEPNPMGTSTKHPQVRLKNHCGNTN